MTFEAEYFDVIIDKGTLDALIVIFTLKINNPNNILVWKRLYNN